MSIPPITSGPLHLKKEQSGLLQSDVFFNGKRYRVTYTPQEGSSEAAHIYKPGHIAKIQNIALGILKAHKDSEGADFEGHEYKAIFTHPSLDSSSSEKVQTFKKKLGSSDDFIATNPKAEALEKLAKEVYQLTTRLELTTSPEITDFTAKVNKTRLETITFEIGGANRRVFKQEYDEALETIQAALALPEAGDKSVIQRSVLDSLKEVHEVPDQAAYQELLGANPAPISNPHSNCFMNAVITGPLSNTTFYSSIVAQLDTILEEAFEDTNPSLPDGEAVNIPIDYKTWDLSTDEKMKEVFAGMTIKQAALCAKNLLNSWHEEDMALNEKQSQLLRLSLIKLFNTSALLQADGSYVTPHVDKEKAGEISIYFTKQESSTEFFMKLLQGLKELTGREYENFKEVNPSLLPREDGGAAAAIDGPDCFDLDDLKGKLGEDRPDVFSITADHNKPIVVPGLSIDLAPSRYEVDSVVVRAATTAEGGHFFTYKIVDDAGTKRVLRYDDYKDPEVFVVSDDEFRDFCEGRVKGLSPCLITYKKN